MSGDASVDRLKLAVERQTRELDRQKRLIDRLESDIDKLKAEKEQRSALPEGVVRFAEMALRSLLILNGGAAIVIILFAVPADGARGDPVALSRLVWIFGLGAGLSVVATCVSYLATLVFHEVSRWSTAQAIRGVAVVAAVASLVAFGAGVRRTADHVSQIAPTRATTSR